MVILDCIGKIPSAETTWLKNSTERPPPPPDALVGVDEQSDDFQQLEYVPNVLAVLGSGPAHHQDAIQLNEGIRGVSKNVVHHTLERHACIT
jgi:hypothetical protein